MGYDTGLAHRIRAKGVRVVEVAGWQTRGSSTFHPRGSVNHHTAGASGGATPSLNVCIYGRPGLPGPLCNVLQSREPVDDIAYVVAAGRANHAGKGGWRGLSGNSSVHGLEVEHVGTSVVPVRRLETAARNQAAFLEAPGSSRNAGLCCQHYEWAPSRKIDFAKLAPWTAESFRDRVRFWIGRTIHDHIEEEDEMANLFNNVAEFKAAVKAVVEEVAEVHDAPGPFRVVDEGYREGWPVYHTDFGSYIRQVLPNTDGGALDQFVMNTKAISQENPNALRVHPKVLDELWWAVHGVPRDRSHLG